METSACLEEKKLKKKMKWHSWGTRRQLDPNFDDN
jgi:hypothetical protein